MMADDFDARWAAWVARGRAHEKRVRLRMMIALPAALIAAVLLYTFLIR